MAFLVCLIAIMAGLEMVTASDKSFGYFHHMDASHCPESLLVNVVIKPQNTKLVLLLKESSREFIPPDAMVHGKFFDLRRRACFYQGGNRDDPEDGSAVAKQVLGSFSATFHHEGATYEIADQPADSPEFEASRLPPAPFKFSCGLDRPHAHAAEHTQPAGHSRRLRRSISANVEFDMNSPINQAEQKYIQLVLIGDKPFVDGTGGDFIKATERLWEIGNYVNNLYKPLGINVATVRADALTSDQLGLGNNASGSVPETMLRSFMNFRMQFLTDIDHTAAHLVSGLRMTGANVGLANYGKLCQFPLAGGVNSDMTMNGSAFNVAVTVTHELGHNLGMEHDPDTPFSCGCRDPQGCIMTAVGTEVNPIRFSNCSEHMYKLFAVPEGLGYCMSRPPSRANLAGRAPKCGNRIIDPGEECDCGTPRFCNNSCCNPTTCKLSSGAACASGQCCNTTSCTLIPRGSLCRAAQGVCDLPEYCNGTSEWCPEIDDYKMDGTACAYDPTNATKVLAYCYKSNCVTRDARCKALFTAPDFRAAPESYAVKTMDDSGFGEGYCSYRPNTLVPLKYTFTPCTFQNRRCGTLYCVGTMPDGFPAPRWRGLADADARPIVPVNPSDQTLAYARLDYSLSGFRDPGMVPDGAECGPGMMCVNSECLNVSQVTSRAQLDANVSSLPNCMGRGDVTRTGLCFCNYGFRPPDCVAIGYGGSITNLPAESGDITTSTTTTPRPTTQTTRFEFTTLEQRRDDFWMFVGIGIAILVVIIAAILFFVWLYCWCRRNDTTPYIGGMDVAATDASAAIKYRSAMDLKSYPLAEEEKSASPDQIVVAAVGFNNGFGADQYRSPVGGVEQKYAVDVGYGVNGTRL